MQSKNWAKQITANMQLRPFGLRQNPSRCSGLRISADRYLQFPFSLAILLIIWYIVCMTFEWDENKNKQNTKKHNISFEEAQYAFLDPKKIILEDKKHSIDEERFFCIGQIGSGIVTVRFTIRNGVIRLFGAGYWREGKQRYEERC